ncbi:Pimeloyl-ACP methyl ester carboxylesterase [Rhizobiales bacterium GAS191]|nr:Pimeloyl-ACP methyl ester carboxylesterase [Rhizobiales bacterium GAS191]
MPVSLATALFAVLVALLVIAAISLAITAIINRRFPPEGKLYGMPGGRLHIAARQPADRPAEATVLLIHGASTSLGDQLLALSDTLASRYRVLAVDRPGQGWSDRKGGALDASPSRQARLIATTLRGAGIEGAVVVGHSFGAAVAAALAIEDPGFVEGLVFVAPASHPWPGGIALHYRLAAMPVLGPVFTLLAAPILGRLSLKAGIREAFAPQSPSEAYARRSGAARALTPLRFRANGQDVANLKRHVEALSPRYREIAAPCVIITGDADAIVWPSIHSEGLARDIAGAKLVTLPGVGHMPHHSHPETVLAAIDDVLGRREGG